MRFCVYYLTRVMLFAAFLLGLKIFLDLLHQTNIIELLILYKPYYHGSLVHCNLLSIHLFSDLNYTS